RGETALERGAGGSNSSGAGPNQRGGVEFSRMRVEFTRTLGRFAIREGVVRGPMIGATSEGYIDYFKDEVHMRGTFVPFFGLNNMFGQIPVFGLFLGGGSNEGLVGLTYEVVGPPNAPVLRVNPVSVVAPGLFRKFFEFSNTSGRGGHGFDPARYLARCRSSPRKRGPNWLRDWIPAFAGMSGESGSQTRSAQTLTSA